MNRDHIFVVPERNSEGDIIGIVGIRTTRKGEVIAAYSHTYEKPHRDEEELFNETILDRRFSKQYVVITIESQSRGSYIFDSFLKLKDNAAQCLNILQLAWPLVYNDQIADESFGEICSHFGLVEGTNAADRCQSLTKVYWEMMKRYRTSLTAEEVARGLGGPVLQKVRGLFNF